MSSNLFGANAAASAPNNTQGDTSKDAPLTDPPDDGISELSFSPTGDFLAVSSWNKKLHIYQVNEQGVSSALTNIVFDGPVLSCAWSHDGTKVAGASADKSARIIDTANPNAPQTVAQHDQPIRSVRFIDNNGSAMLVTGSWDKTVKYWDLRSAQPVATLECQERVYAMDVRTKLLVIGTADRYINIVDLANPTKFFKTIQSPLKFQTRVVSCFNDATGFAVGSIEGRCAIQYVDEKDSSSNFSFRCHRETPPSGTTGTNSSTTSSNVYAVNAISWHPVHGTFSTAGSDGTYHFWDKDAKHRLKGYPAVGGSITTTGFNRTGTIFAYAVSYDWSQGFQKNTQQYPNKVMLHPVNQEEVKPRPKANKR